MKQLLLFKAKQAFKILILLLLIITGQSVFSQTQGDLDLTFNATDTGNGIGDGPNSIVHSTVVQPDGKIIIGGSFTSYNGTLINRIARLNVDGSLDATFNPGTGANNGIYSVVLQPDGKIIIGGYFGSYNGSSRNRIARLNANGSLDASFNPGTGIGSGTFNTIHAIALQPDGKILIGGQFTSYNGTTKGNVARLNANGTLDSAFTTITTNNSKVYCILLQPDNKILLGGNFVSCNNIVASSIARLNADGTLDPAFNVSMVMGVSGDLYSMALQSDGKIVVGGSFAFRSDLTRRHFGRLNLDGTLDTTFNTAFNTDTQINYPVRSVAVQPDGKIIAGGNFTSYNGTEINRIGRFNVDGSLDTGFNPGLGVDVLYPNSSEYVYAVRVQTDGRILLAGNYGSYNGTVRNFMTRLNTDASSDISFNPGRGANGFVNNMDILAIALQSDNKILIGGNFTSFNGFTAKRIGRLNTDGTLDGSFNSGTGANDFVNTIAAQSNGKILIGGNFSAFNDIAVGSICRLNTDGTLDTAFNSGTGVGAYSSVNRIVLQPNGKFLISGNFSSYNGVSRNRIARLNNDGTLDTTFDPSTGPSSTIYVMAVQPDGKILIGGTFYSYNGIAAHSIARLNVDGTLDSTFNVTGTGTYDVQSIILQPDGKILISGSFMSYNDIAMRGIARLNADGSLDSSFSPTTVMSGSVRSIVLQTDGKIMTGGDFSSYNGTTRKCLARLNSNGSSDTTFNTGVGPNGPTGSYNTVTSMVMDSNNKLIIGGSFTNYSGTGRNRLARIHAGSILGVDNHLQEEIKIYPNPVKDILHFALGENIMIKNYSIYDLFGKLIASVNTTFNTADVSNLTKGIYILKIQTHEGELIKKFVKE
ncbi:MAG: T9SS type A sorting domain-containing protein [Flavobacterium sp.]